MAVNRDWCGMRGTSLKAVLTLAITGSIFSLGVADEKLTPQPVQDKNKVQGELLALLQDDAAEAGEGGANQTVAGEWHIRTFYGVAQCILCHSRAPSNAPTLPGGTRIKIVDDGWILYSEYPIWAQKDKHVQAYAVLLNERSKKMGELLGTDVSRDQRCIACHSGTPIALVEADEKGLVNKEAITNVDLMYGVTCEGCHGGSGGEDGWYNPHTRQPVKPYKDDTWRFMTPDQKKKHGFNDVRSPAARARLCSSCHLGDAGMGRVVTHDMYAAGHPPLPGFEIESFIDQMPRHWRFFDEKKDKGKSNFIENTKDELYKGDRFKEDSLLRTRSMLIGSIVVLSQNVKLISDLANNSDAGGLKIKPEWPELAQFECFACHHDLKYPGWRQTRKPPGVPGRPTLREWPMAIPKIAVKFGGLDEVAFDKALKAVVSASVARTLGDANKLKASSDAFAKWADEAAANLERTVIGRDQGKAILQAICDVCANETLDYDSARQMAWAFMIVEREVRGERNVVVDLGKELGDALTFGNPLRGYADDDSFLAALKSLDYNPDGDGNDGLFLLNLRKGRTAKRDLPDGESQLPTIEVDLTKTMPVYGSYEPDEFKKRFAKVAELVDKL